MKVLQIFVAATASLLFLFPSSGWSQKYQMKLMSGPMGGAWYPLGGAIAEAIQKEVSDTSIAVAPGAGISNVEALDMGKCEIGLSNSITAVDGLYGRPPFKKKMENVRQWANLYFQHFQIIALEGSGIKSVADMKGKVISTAPRGNTGEYAATQVLQVHNLTYKDMSKVHQVNYNDTVALMQDGHCQGWFIVINIPAAPIMDLAMNRKIRLIELPDDKIKELQKINAGYTPGVVPKGTYHGVDYDVRGVGWYSHVMVSAKLPDDLVYNMTKALVKNLPVFKNIVKDVTNDPKDLAQDIGIPLHPGAWKYYKEIGALK